jgi:hypothetical protein
MSLAQLHPLVCSTKLIFFFLIPMKFSISRSDNVVGFLGTSFSYQNWIRPTEASSLDRASDLALELMDILTPHDRCHGVLADTYSPKPLLIRDPA